MKKAKLNLLSWAFLSMSLLMATSCDEEDDAAPVAPPTAAFTSITGEAVEDWQVATFTNVSSGSVSWAWSYGDDATSVEFEEAHTYAVAGEYDVTLVATNSEGVTNSVTQTVIITEVEEEPEYDHVDPITPTSDFYNTFNGDAMALEPTEGDAGVLIGETDPAGSELTVGRYQRGTAQYSDLKFQQSANIVTSNYSHMRIDIYFPSQNLSPYGESGDGELYQRVDIFIANLDFGNFWEDWTLFRDEDQQDKNTWLRYEFDLAADGNSDATARTDLNLVGLKLGGENFTTDAEFFIRNFEFYSAAE